MSSFSGRLTQVSNSFRRPGCANAEVCDRPSLGVGVRSAICSQQVGQR